MMGAIKRFFHASYSIPVVLIIWELCAHFGIVSPRILPPLENVFRALVEDFSNGELPYHIAITVERTLTGFAIGSVGGVLVGFILSRVSWVDYLFEPIFFAGYAVPKISLFPIFTFMFGIGTPSKVAFAALECLYPMVVATHAASRLIPQQIIWAGENMGMNNRQLLWSVLIPACLPGILNGLRIALPIGLTIVIVTEMIGDTHGVGFYIANYGALFRPERVYAGMICIGVLGLIFDRAVLFLSNRITHARS